MQLQDSVKKELKHITIYTLIGLVAMLALFALVHFCFYAPVPFDYRVALAGILGSLVAIGNFFWLCLTVQKVASMEDEHMATLQLRASYSRRMMFQVFWVIIAIVAPCFQFAAGIIPLIFPTMGIRVVTIINYIKKS